jgi:hypothetical protein
MRTMNTTNKQTASMGLSLPNVLLRLEGLTILIGAIALYASQGYSGLAFVLLILVPDLSTVGYLVNTQVGSYLYNAAHFYTLPALLIALGLMGSAPLAIQLGLIWFAHIGMDRVVGYGLKYPNSFKETHLQRV